VREQLDAHATTRRTTSLGVAARAGCVAAVLAPVVIAVVYGADFLDFANESTAYRFFFCVRVVHGETVVVGAGYLLGAIQQVIYSCIRAPIADPAALREQIQAFAFWTNVALAALLAGLLLASFADRRLREEDSWLVALVPIISIWGTRVTGFDYALMADYHLLNIILVTGSVWLFIREWRRSSPSSLWDVALAGLWLGVIMANKVTLVVIGLPAVMVVVSSHRERTAAVIWRTLLAAGAAVCGFAVVVAASYRFDATGLLSTFWRLLAFVLNPGGERQFWTGTFLSFLLTHGYGVMALFFAVTSVVAIRMHIARGWTIRARYGVISLIGCGIAAAWFVLQRPAGSTLFESSVFLLGLGAMLMATLPTQSRRVAPVLCASWILFAAMTFDWHDAIAMVRFSKTRGEAKWQHYETVRTIAGSRPITVVFPSNAFHHEGVFELLLKGAVDFPTWQISDRGRTLLSLFAPGVSFRHDLGGPTPNETYPDNSVLVWYVTPTIDPRAKYPTLASAVGRCIDRPTVWRLEGKAGQVRVIGHACVLGSA
jgi:hypothetical protein